MTRAAPRRFREADQPSWWAAARWLVRCPRCDRQATVELSQCGTYGWPWQARAACVHCGFADSATSDTPHWRGPVVVSAATRCGGCGRQLRRPARRLPSAPARRTTLLACPGCGAQTRATLRVSVAEPRQPVDAYFGLDLWLQASCRGEVVWAINEAHLTFLLDYVTATLRERVPNSNRSAASRLPTWMKRANHRASVVACLEQLRRSLVDPRHSAAPSPRPKRTRATS